MLARTKTLTKRTAVATLLLCLAAVEPRRAQSAEYDPLQIHSSAAIKVEDLTIRDEQRSRDIPIRVYRSSSDQKQPVVLFSHGLGGSRRGGGYLGKHWAQRGYVVVAMQHAGSDETVWRGVGIAQRMTALREAANFQNSQARYDDVRQVINQLALWHASSTHPLHGRLDLAQIGMSGHSYGASTTQGVSGQWAPILRHRYRDDRISAAVMLSPNRPRRLDPKVAFGKVAIPWMLMTGTNDTSPINDTTVQDRLSVYPALPDSIDKFQVVLDKAHHSAFSDGRARRNEPRNPNHHRVILGLSTAFWDSYLQGNEKARQWLIGSGPRRLMEAADQWDHHIGQPQ